MSVRMLFWRMSLPYRHRQISSFGTVFLAFTCLLLADGTARAATVIDTFPLWNGTNFINAFGETDTATYGQTFVAPASNSVMTSFTFALDDSLNPDIVDFDAYVYAWDGSKATGAPLFTAGPLSTTNNGGGGGFETFTVDTGSLALVPNNSYVAFFTASNRFDGESGTAIWAYLGTSFSSGFDGYTDGNFVFLNHADNFSALTTATWANPSIYGGDPTHDLAFRITFVPEPSAIAIAMLSGISLWMCRRRLR